MSTDRVWATVAAGRRRRAKTSLRALSFGLFGAAGALAMIGTGPAWLVTLIGVGVSGLLLWGALRGDSVLAPIAVLLGTCLFAVAANDGFALPQVLAAVLALAVGESVSAHRRLADSSLVASTPNDATLGTLTVGLVGAGAAIGTLAIALVPEWRFWSLGAVGAAIVLTVAINRRQRSLPPASWPPPPPPLTG
jgi:hypothetical protein